MSDPRDVDPDPARIRAALQSARDGAAPARREALAQAACSGMVVLLSALTVAQSPHAFVLIPFFGIPFFALITRLQSARAATTRARWAAVQVALAQNDLDLATALLDRFAPVRPPAPSAPVEALMRAEIALRRGETRGAATMLDAALGPSGSPTLGGYPRIHAYATRAMCRALAGISGADADAREVDSRRARLANDPTLIDDRALEYTMARAAIARMVLAVRAGHRRDLDTQILRGRAHALAASAHERALFHAIEASAKHTQETAYRAASSPLPTTPQASRGWVAAVLPEVAAHAPHPLVGYDADVRRAGGHDVAPKASARAVTASILTLALGVVLVAFIVLVGTAKDPTGDLLLALDAAVLLVPTALWIRALRGRAARGADVALANRAFLRAASERDAALDDVAAVPTRDGYVAAYRAMSLWTGARRRGDFALALRACDEALPAATKTRDTLRDAVLATRAKALAALGRIEEARDDLARISTTHPVWRALTTFGVELVGAVATRDFDAAKDLARRAPTAALDDRLTEILVGLLLRRTEDAPSAEWERVEAAAQAPDAQAFLRALAPELLDELGVGDGALSAPHGDAGDERQAPQEDDEEAEDAPLRARAGTTR